MSSRSGDNTHFSASASGGFALVIALSLMAFILLLLLSITTLVQVEQAGSTANLHKMEAEQAALLSLNLAIGKLQETAGLDQRVTAPAEAVATANGPKHLTGVWRSWEGKDHQANGLPIAPNYGSKLNTGELEIDSSQEGRFLSWLVSSEFDPAKTAASSASAPPLLQESANTVPLVSVGSVDSGDSGDVADEVHVQPTEYNDAKIEIAWWVSGENTKARLSTPEDTSSYSELDWSERMATSSAPDANTFEVTATANQAKLDRVASRDSLNSLSDRSSSDTPISADYFHDLTTYSRGLLTNTANGGWRRDLSLMAEQWATLEAPGGGTDNYPFFTLSPGVESAALKNSGAAGGLIYPWAEASTFKTGQQNAQSGGGSMGWAGLVDFATQYKEIVTGTATGNITFDPKSGNSRDVINRLPVLARIHWVLSFESIDDGNVDGDGSALFRSVLNMNPVVTYWNPYNVAISGTEGFWLFLTTQLPYDMKFSVGDIEQDAFYTLEDFIVSNGKNIINFAMPDDYEDWQPGEARVYSIAGRDNNSPNRFRMRRGYTDATGFNRTIKTSGRGGVEMEGNSDDTFTVELTDASTDTFVFDLYEWRTPLRANALDVNSTVPYDNSELYWPEPVVKNTTQKMGDLAAGDPSPFMIMMFQLANITEYSVSGRGYSQKKPTLSNVSQQQTVGDIDAFPFDVVMRYPNGNDGGTSDSGLPVDGITDIDPYSFIGTSYRFDDGLNSLITNEIPTRPLRSLGELEHFDVGFYSPVAPYVANPVGNSNASHLIEPDLVYVDDGTAESVRAAYDHSYVANHLFFDDWFVSSIAPDTDGYSAFPASIRTGSSGSSRDTKEVYRAFISGETPLPNTAYLPAELRSTSAASAAADDLMSDDSSWYDVASELEVDGMFNVNSTSVEAWTALLKHLKDSAMPYVSVPDTAATDWTIGLDTNAGHPVGRTTIAGGSSPLVAEEYSQIGMHARLTDAQIEALATEIVNQVKERGPFLSLAEFVNRQLSSDGSASSLALAGAIESALAELSTRGATENPYADIQTTFSDNVDVPVEVTHAFPAAAEGNLAYGFPGWVRQADVLRPLAPVLSARDDTFVIRAYGERKDPISGETQAGAWCEAVVQRRADYVDSHVDESTVLPSDATLDSEANKRFGRRFSIVSFRWLSPDEV